jgi:hypothetical protein
MKTRQFAPLSVLVCAMMIGANAARATVNPAGVVPIDAASTTGAILETAGTVDLALNLGDSSGSTINGIAFTGAVLSAGTPVVGAGATLTPNAPTPSATSLRNLANLNGFLWPTTGDFAGVMGDLVDSQRFPAQAGDALNFTISGLDANRFYFIQVFSGDTRAENENQNYTLGGVTQNAQFGNGGTNDGALVKFTATGETTLTLSVSNVTGASPPMLAGILIRSVEPGLFAPLTAMGTGNGSPFNLTIQIGNGAAVPYHITGASFTGPNAGEFSTGTTLPLVVPAAGTADFTVNVVPTAGGTRTAVLTLATNDPAVPSLDVSLTVDIADPDIVIDPSHDFGSTAALPGTVTGNVFVDNIGGATNLTVSAPVITGPGAAAFGVTSLPAPIAPGTLDSVVLTYNPSAPGYHAAQLQLTTNDPFTPTVTVQLKGEVTGDLISPVTVSAVSSENIFGIDRDANRTIDGSGLTGLGSAGSTHRIGENSLVWTTNGVLAAPNDLAPFITYDLGAVYQITRIREWGYNDPTLNITYNTQAMVFGPNQVEIFTSTDNVTFASAGTVNFAQAPGTAGYAGNDIPVALPAARYIRLEIRTNHAGAIFDGTGANPGTTDPRGLTGLSEIRFEGTAVPASPFDLWLDSFSLTGADRNPDADSDKDGSENLIEYITGGIPNVSDPDKLPRIEVTGGSLIVTFTRPNTVSGATIRFEVGTNLANWTDVYTVGTSPEVAITPNGTDPDTITLTLPAVGQPKRFVRLAAELAP